MPFLWTALQLHVTRHYRTQHIISHLETRYKIRGYMLQLKCIHCQCAFCFHEQANNAYTTQTHKNGESCIKTGVTGNNAATAQRTGARKLGWFCTVGTWINLCTFVQMRCSCTGGNHQGRTRVATDTYPLTCKNGPGQALQCSMVMIPADILIRNQLT